MIIGLVLLSFAMDIFFRKDSGSAGSKGEEMADTGQNAEVTKRRRLYLTSLVLFVSLVGVCAGGIIFAVPTAFILFALFLGKKRDVIRSLYLSFILTGTVYAIFKYILHFPLTRGLFG